MLLREPNIFSLKAQRLCRKCSPTWVFGGRTLPAALLMLFGSTSLILEIITSSLESSYLQTSRGNVGALLPMRTAALARLASLRPEAPGRSGTMAPCGS